MCAVQGGLGAAAAAGGSARRWEPSAAWVWLLSFAFFYNKLFKYRVNPRSVCSRGSRGAPVAEVWALAVFVQKLFFSPIYGVLFYSF